MTTNGGSVHFTDSPGHQDTSTICANTIQIQIQRQVQIQIQTQTQIQIQSDNPGHQES